MSWSEGNPTPQWWLLILRTAEFCGEGGGRDAWQGAPTVGWPDESPYQWTGTEKLASYSTPVVATPHGQLHLLCLTRQGLISLDPDTGRARFRRWFQSPVDESVNAMCPVVHDDRVLISAAYYRIGSVLLGVEPGGNSFREVWRSPDRKGSSTGQPASAPVLEAHWSTPVFHKGYLYSFSGRNESDALLRCVEFDTGRLAWSRDERWRAHSTRQPRAYGRGSLILAEGKLIVLGEGGRLGPIQPQPAPTGGAELVASAPTALPLLDGPRPCGRPPLSPERKQSPVLRSEGTSRKIRPALAEPG